MLIVRPVGVGVVGYYLKEGGQGRWIGAGTTHLDLRGPPEASTLRRVLAGLDPRTAHRLGGTHAHRRAGWDLVFAAPKSLSLVTALAPPDAGRLLEEAQAKAVEATLQWMATEATWARRAGQSIAADGLVGAAFDHRRSAAGDPHIHTHVLLANIVHGPDGRWSALDSSQLWRTSRAIGAIYDLALRHEVADTGLGLGWVIGADGIADIAGVAKDVIGAASFRQGQIRAALGDSSIEDAQGEQLGAQPSPRRRRAAAATSRSDRPATGWNERLAEAGFGAADVATLLSGGVTDPPVPSHEALSASAIETATLWLADRGSSWSRSDALCALAATLPGGASPQNATAGGIRICIAGERCGPERWTAAVALERDELVRQLVEGGRPSLAAVPERTIEEVLGQRRDLPRGSAERTRRMLDATSPVEVLGGRSGVSSLIEQAAVLDTARAAWQATGHRVVVDAPVAARRRWQALIGVDDVGPGRSGDVVVVDRADRRTSADLASLLARAAKTRSKVVLVEGGTLSALRLPSSAAFASLRRAEDDWLGPSVGRNESSGRRQCAPATVITPRLVVCGSLVDAVEVLVERWITASQDARPLLIGLGAAEVDAINAATRLRRMELGEIGPDGVVIAGRGFSIGDEVVSYRPGPVPVGWRGQVRAVSVSPATLTVRWNGEGDGDDPAKGEFTYGAWDARRLGHGYAVGPGLAARIDAPAWVLGDPSCVALDPRRLRGVSVAASTQPATPTRDRLTELAHSATAPLFSPAEHHRPATPGSAPRWATIDPAAIPLADLIEERSGLRSRLLGSLPSDARPDRRRFEEDRSWLEQRPGPTPPAVYEDLARREQHLLDQEAALGPWLNEHVAELQRLQTLERAQERRTDLLVHAIAGDATTDEHRRVGPRPAGELAQKTWRRAIRAVAVHADRWPTDDLSKRNDRSSNAGRTDIGAEFAISRTRCERLCAEVSELRERETTLGRSGGREVDSGLGR